MTFTQIEFFIFFVAGVLLPLYFLKGERIRKSILLLANVYFYSFVDIRFLLLLMGIILTTYLIVKYLREINDPVWKKLLLFSGIFINTAILLYFKYFNFFVESFQKLFSNNGVPSSALQIIAPLGVSFYTFRFISYLVDAYKDPENNEVYRCRFIDFMIYGTFFPDYRIRSDFKGQTLHSATTQFKAVNLQTLPRLSIVRNRTVFKSVHR